eukprot:SAG11_NODE_5329_length_1594_cov_2.235452_1_plen_332_part_10
MQERSSLLTEGGPETEWEPAAVSEERVGAQGGETVYVIATWPAGSSVRAGSWPYEVQGLFAERAAADAAWKLTKPKDAHGLFKLVRKAGAGNGWEVDGKALKSWGVINVREAAEWEAVKLGLLGQVPAGAAAAGWLDPSTSAAGLGDDGHTLTGKRLHVQGVGDCRVLSFTKTQSALGASSHCVAVPERGGEERQVTLNRKGNRKTPWLLWEGAEEEEAAAQEELRFVIATWPLGSSARAATWPYVVQGPFERGGEADAAWKKTTLKDAHGLFKLRRAGGGGGRWKVADDGQRSHGAVDVREAAEWEAVKLELLGQPGWELIEPADSAAVRA